MADEPPVKGDPLTLVFWLTWAAQQGIAIFVLICTSVSLGYYLVKIQPEHDAMWAKVIETKDKEITKMLEERDKRFLEYRVKAEERSAKAVTDLATETSKTIAGLTIQKDKDIDRAISLLTSRINDIQKSAEKTAAKVETLMP